MENFINYFEIDDEKEEQSGNRYKHVQKPEVDDEELDHKERDEDSQINVSPYYSNLEISCQKELFCLLDSIGENNGISDKAYKEDEVLNSRSLNENFDISFGNCHESSLHNFFEDRFDNMQEELHFEQPSHGK